LGYCYSQLNQFEKAAAMTLRSLELRRRILGEENPRTMSSVLILARTYVQQQKFDKAGPLTDEALNLMRGLAIENDPFLSSQVSNLGWAYLEQGQVAKADTLCEVAWKAMRRKPDNNPLANPRIITQLGSVRLAQEKYSAAETLLRESSRLVAKHWPDAAYQFYVMSLLGASLSGQKKYAEAEPLLLQGCQGLQQRQSSMPPYLNATRRVTESLERRTHPRNRRWRTFRDTTDYAQFGRCHAAQSL
jgi:tetratricopeptide (TPR) repeat protein